MKRTKSCGKCTENEVGHQMTLMGWVAFRRDMGGVIFLDLRDREGTLQVVCSLSRMGEADFAVAEHLRMESVIMVRGTLHNREPDTYNPRLPTGAIELRAEALELLSASDPLPFPLEGAAPREELRMQYRYLDLRRPQMLENLRFRHRISQYIRAYLDSHGFIEVETPMLTRSTPEGARDYLVPSRVHPGSFYALPQSPQIFKQLLMVGGIEKYYQFARCFRDEDLRADRQPEFTQVDLELSFVDQEDILQFLEHLFRHLFRESFSFPINESFPRITWQQAMDRYGSDKPDLRFGLPIVDLTELAGSCDFTVFRKTVESGGVVRAINAKGQAGFSRGVIESLTEKAVSLGAKGMAWIAIREDGSLYSVLTKYFSSEAMKELLRRVDGTPGDFVLFCADRLETVRRVLGTLRLELADRLNLRSPEDYRFLFVTDFPAFEWSEEEERYVAAHHPFTMPNPEDLPYLCTEPERVRSLAYDLVLNGVELGSGSVRIHDRQIQEQMFEALGFTRETAWERFEFLLTAFRFGTPPHAGFAFGLDRLAMLMTGAGSLRDVIAFPKNKDAACPLTSAPSPVEPRQLAALKLGGTVPQPEQSFRTVPESPVERAARLSMLELTPEQERKLEPCFQDILAFAGQLDTFQTESYAEALPVLHPCVLREDVLGPGMDREELLENGLDLQNGCFKVPKVL